MDVFRVVMPSGNGCSITSQPRIALITSSPLDAPSQGGGFRDTLAREFGVDRNISLVISPDGCGESAIGSVRVVVDKLRAAGYLQVSVAGSLAKPNAKCGR